MRPRIATLLFSAARCTIRKSPASAPGTASSTTFATTVRPPPCVVRPFLGPSFSFPVFMVKWPVTDDVAELVADSIFSSLRISPTSLPTFPHTNDTLRYDTRRLRGNGFSLPRAYTQTPGFSAPPISSGLGSPCISLSFSLPMYRISFFFLVLFLNSHFYTHC